MTENLTNNLFQLAESFIKATNHPVFLTGKAGTGKTTFLKHIKATTTKQLAVVAPTGVAAINAGGVTIHSFFQLPFAPFLPTTKQAVEEGFYNKHSLLARMRINNERRKIWQQLELLIIDEISMVRCDVLDAIDTILRHYRKCKFEPFGGVQVLLIGDLYQLPPVVQDGEWTFMQPFYQSPFFFDSQVIQQQAPAYIELEKVYRQRDNKFINLLNEIRENTLSNASTQLINKIYEASQSVEKKDGYITLTTHNKQADIINETALAALTTAKHTFTAIVEGEFPEKSYPADFSLELKVGAQVMFIKNDTEKIKRFYNGKIGVITQIESETITVNCQNGNEKIVIVREKWRNIKYRLNTTTQQVEEEELGTFQQFPLRLAWAITIHKSQGLTFEKAIIDAGNAFAPGQVYVALSRCTSLDGLLLKSNISATAINTDKRIIQYISHVKQQNQLQGILGKAQHHYQKQVLKALFQFKKEWDLVNELKEFVEENLASFKATETGFIAYLQENIHKIYDLGEKFGVHIEQLTQTEQLPEQNEALQKRIIAGAQYFQNSVVETIQIIKDSPLKTDSKNQAIKYIDLLTSLYELVFQKKQQLLACTNGYQSVTFEEEKNKLKIPLLDLQVYNKNNTNSNTDIPNQVLYRQLQTLRNSLADKENLPIYMVAGTKTLEELAIYLPNNKEELAQIAGFGKAKIGKYGDAFLNMINAYCVENNLCSTIHLKENTKKTTPKQLDTTHKAPKVASSAISLSMFKELNNIEKVAEARNFSVSTIESHLIKYIATGELAVSLLIDEKTLKAILEKMDDLNETSLTTVKNALDASYTYTQIKAAIAYKTFLVSNTENNTEASLV
ncbi:MAG: helix-turn-helix domain-containing protein [Chitinophagaceae bacterium]